MTKEELLDRLPEIETRIRQAERTIKTSPVLPSTENLEQVSSLLALCTAVRELAAENEELKKDKQELFSYWNDSQNQAQHLGQVIQKYKDKVRELKEVRDCHFKSQRIMLEDIHLLGHGVIQQKKEIERLKEWISRASDFDIGNGYRIGKHADDTGWSVWDKYDDLVMLLHAETPDDALKAWKNDSYSNNK